MTYVYLSSTSFGEFGVVGSHEVIEVVVHLLQHCVAQRIQGAAECVVDGVRLAAAGGAAQLLPKAKLKTA